MLRSAVYSRYYGAHLRQPFNNSAYVLYIDGGNPSLAYLSRERPWINHGVNVELVSSWCWLRRYSAKQYPYFRHHLSLSYTIGYWREWERRIEQIIKGIVWWSRVFDAGACVIAAGAALERFGRACSFHYADILSTISALVCCEWNGKCWTHKLK